MSTKRAAKLAIVHDTEHPRAPSSRAQQSNALRLKIDHLKTFAPLTDNQKLFYDAYKRGDYFMALHGVAGTGKTFIAVYKALEEVLDKTNPFNKIIIVRSAVQSREMGHLPGDIDEKLDIYQQPYRQICTTLFDRKDAYDRLAEQGHIEFISTSVRRGEKSRDYSSCSRRRFGAVPTSRCCLPAGFARTQYAAV